jgi:plastocyanin
MTRARPRLLWVGLGLVVAGLFVLGIGIATGAAGASGPIGPEAGEFDGPGPMMGGVPGAEVAPGPGSPGFVPGTAASPRVVPIVATASLRFVPDVVTVKQGETITFEVTTVGPISHEFMVGPAADVGADAPGTPEIPEIGMMETRSLTYTFAGPGPYAFACHAPGHYEAGMDGTIVVVP